jgi:RHS repeat-associated protein
VTDQLGTPRMIFDKSGSLATTKRHDYAPFGEELFNGARPSVVGYAAADSTRQKFTSKERDLETGLDYFGARYYGSVEGRFTSADPLYIDLRRLKDPQQLNIYAYTRNNPLAFTDPTGFDIKATNSQKEEYLKRLKGAVSFEMHLNKNDMVKITGKDGKELSKKELNKLGKTLTGGDKEIFNAITDTNNHVIMDTGNGQPNAGVDFASQGSSSGNLANKTLDMTDINRLGSGNESVGLSSEQAVAHETLEAYSLAQGNIWSDAHAYAAGNFGGLNYVGPDRGFGPEGGNMINLVKTQYSIQGQSNANLIITKELVTPIPVQQFRNLNSPLPGNITDIQKRKP